MNPRPLSGRGITATGRPTLIVVSGPPGSGKTTLAHELARAIPCPAICRDEIKEGMVHAASDFTPAPGDPLTQRTLRVFFDALRLLLDAGVTVVAEAAFQDKVWRSNLAPFQGRARILLIHGHVDPVIARERIARRAPDRAAHADAVLLEDPERATPFEPPAMSVLSMHVDTTDGYTPALEEIVAFVGRETE